MTEGEQHVPSEATVLVGELDSEHTNFKSRHVAGALKPLCSGVWGNGLGGGGLGLCDH